MSGEAVERHCYVLSFEPGFAEHQKAIVHQRLCTHSGKTFKQFKSRVVSLPGPRLESSAIFSVESRKLCRKDRRKACETEFLSMVGNSWAPIGSRLSAKGAISPCCHAPFGQNTCSPNFNVFNRDFALSVSSGPWDSRVAQRHRTLIPCSTFATNANGVWQVWQYCAQSGLAITAAGGHFCNNWCKTILALVQACVPQPYLLAWFCKLVLYNPLRNCLW